MSDTPAIFQYIVVTFPNSVCADLIAQFPRYVGTEPVEALRQARMLWRQPDAHCVSKVVIYRLWQNQLHAIRTVAARLSSDAFQPGMVYIGYTRSGSTTSLPDEQYFGGFHAYKLLFEPAAAATG